MNIAILGCSGSIGTTTLNIIRKYSNDFNVVLLANDKNQDALKKLGKEFKNANLWEHLFLTYSTTNKICCSI